MHKPIILFSVIALGLSLISIFQPNSCYAIGASSIANSGLEEGFLNPPASARAHTWWHWMNGYITKDGITRDMEAMKQAGLNGFHIFFDGEMPKGPVKYGSPEQLELLEHAASEAQRLGMEFTMHNCPGFSSSGGPWNTPDISMQQLVWTETYLTGGGDVEIDLPKPFAKLDYYRDAMVIAFPSIKGEDSSMKERLAALTSNAGPVEISRLNSSNLDQGIEIKPGVDNTPGYLLFEFSEPFEARAVSLYASPLFVGTGLAAVFRGGSASLLEASDDGVNFRKVCDVSISGGGFMGAGTDAPAIAGFEPVTARFFRLSSTSGLMVSDLKLAASPRIPGWTGKANFKSMSGGIMPGMATEDAPEPTLSQPVEDDMVINPEDVIDITKHMDADGRLRWRVPEGNWTVLRIGSTTVGVENHPAPDGGGGLECDKYSQEAIEHHFNGFFNAFLPTLEAMADRGMVVGGLIDSYEVGYQNWTKRMPEEFNQRKGYNLIPYMPVMTGRIVGDMEMSERFLWDLRRTQADMMADYYYGHFSELCHRHGMTSLTEPYSGGPFEEMQIGSRVDIPMGEFWVGGSQFERDENWVKTATSAAHVNGKSIVGAESFTGMPTNAKWQQYPFSMKAQGDWMFALGINRYIFHEYAHQPHPNAVPGMTMGQWGGHFERTNTWYSKATGWLDYIARCQYLLQQGLYVADAAYFIGPDAPKANPTKDALKPSLPEGLQYDTINMEAILNRIEIKDGRMVLPDGMSYKLLILPEGERKYPVALMTRIQELVNQGMYVYGPKPEGTPGLIGYPDSDAEVKRIAESLWGDIDGTVVTGRTAGKGKIFWGMPIEDVLREIDVNVDFQYTSYSGDAAVHYVHKRIDHVDYYFLSNRRRRQEDLVCTFRIDGRQPELWDAVTGSIIKAPVFHSKDKKISMPLHLDSAGSAFVVFREKGPESRYTGIKKGDKNIISTENYVKSAKGRYADVQDDFTISVWLKPEIDMTLPGDRGGFMNIFGRGNTNYAIYPPSGSHLYGEGHAACGLTAGRSGVIVYEREAGDPVAALVVSKPLSGWTHVAVTYQGGVPAIYIDGNMTAKGEKSAHVVHPGLHEAYLSDGASFYWGDMGTPELYGEVLSEARIRELAAAGVPDPEAPPVMEVFGTDEGSGLLIWQDGDYVLEGVAGSEAFRIDGAGLAGDVSGPWTVSFPPNMGAPLQITLPRLMSLHRHSEEGVKYFSGTATYTNRFTIAEDALDKGKRLFLDLGRVEILAQVKVNGKDLGIFWAQPYRIDITDVARVGENSLEVAVTNLWPNRLIGDEQLPAENEYESTNFMGGRGGQIRAYPEWYLKGEPKPEGGRVTFTVYQHYFSDSPLLASGLIGPVRLRSAVVIEIGL